MLLSELFLAELEREAVGTRKVLERVPEGKNDWKPHPKSMKLGYLAVLVATMPTWVAMMVKQDELDIRPAGGKTYAPQEVGTREELLRVLEQSLQTARDALAGASNEHLLTTWRFLVGGQVVDEKPRHIMIRDTINHLAHHRGQLTVYLRLNDAPVPAIYGPSADEKSF